MLICKKVTLALTTQKKVKAVSHLNTEYIGCSKGKAARAQRDPQETGRKGDNKIAMYLEASLLNWPVSR